MATELTRYAVSGWGVGELWTEDDVVLAHDFVFGASTESESDVVTALDGPRPRKGVHDPPSSTLALHGPRWGNSSVASSPRATRARDRSPASGRARTRVGPEALVDRFASFLAGEGVAFDDVPLDESAWTPFQSAVAGALRPIPRGEVVTYGELAALAGHPGAQRAVGTFCARNRFMILVPCHRVVAADGIGSYGSAGVAVKRRLLANEGVAF